MWKSEFWHFMNRSLESCLCLQLLKASNFPSNSILYLAVLSWDGHCTKSGGGTSSYGGAALLLELRACPPICACNDWSNPIRADRLVATMRMLRPGLLFSIDSVHESTLSVAQGTSSQGTTSQDDNAGKWNWHKKSGGGQKRRQWISTVKQGKLPKTGQPLQWRKQWFKDAAGLLNCFYVRLRK